MGEYGVGKPGIGGDGILQVPKQKLKIGAFGNTDKRDVMQCFWYIAGAVMGDISASRGRVTGMETDERGDTVVIAQAPLAELTDYSTRLRSITRGTGDFTMKPAGYEQVPYDVQAKLVERYEEGRAK